MGQPLIPPVSGTMVIGVRADTPVNTGGDGDFEMLQFTDGKANVLAGGPVARVLGTLNGVSPVLAAAGDYAAGDVLSDAATNGTGHAFVFAGMARQAGGSGIVAKALITSSVQGWVPAMRLWLFHALPAACELDDNSAFSLDADDRDKVVGYIDFEAGFDAGEVSFVQNTDVRLAYKCAAADTSLYGILQVTEAATNESAGMTLTVALHSLQD